MMTDEHPDPKRHATVTLVVLYALAVLPVFYSGHLVPADTIRMGALGGALGLAALRFGRQGAIPDRWIIAVPTCWVGFALTQYDPLLAAALSDVAPDWDFLVITTTLMVALTVEVVRQLVSTQTSHLRRMDWLVCLPAVATIVLVLSLAEESGDSPAPWVSALKIAQLAVAYLAIVSGTRQGVIRTNSRSWGGLPRVLMMAAAGLLVSATIATGRVWMADSHLRAGAELLSRDDVAEAVAELEKAADMTLWARPDVLAELARAYGRSGQRDRALDLLGRADKLEPGPVDVRRSIALALASVGRTEDAISRLRGLSEDQSSVEALISLTLAAGNAEEARGLLARTESADELVLASEQERVVAARLLMTLGRMEEARAYLRTDGIPHRVDARTWVQLGEWHDVQGATDSAMVCARTALDVSPGHAPARRLVAKLLKNDGEASRALVELRHAVEADSADLVTLDDILQLADGAEPEEVRRWERLHESASTSHIPSSAWPRGGEMGWNMSPSVTLNLPSGGVVIEIDARGTQAAHEYAHFNVSLLNTDTGERRALGSFYSDHDMRAYTVSTQLAKAGVYKLRVHFDNDGVAHDAAGVAVEDRNLYVGDVRVWADDSARAGE